MTSCSENCNLLYYPSSPSSYLISTKQFLNEWYLFMKSIKLFEMINVISLFRLSSACVNCFTRFFFKSTVNSYSFGSPLYKILKKLVVVVHRFSGLMLSAVYKWLNFPLWISEMNARISVKSSSVSFTVKSTPRSYTHAFNNNVFLITNNIASNFSSYFSATM